MPTRNRVLIPRPVRNVTGFPLFPYNSKGPFLEGFVIPSFLRRNFYDQAGLSRLALNYRFIFWYRHGRVFRSVIYFRVMVYRL